MRKFRAILFLFTVILWLTTAVYADFVPSGLLEIHYVNVGWGTSVLVIGPDGTRMLIDGGRDYQGTNRVIPYMESMNLMPFDGLTYIVSSHLHSDHLAGLTETMNGGYDVSTAVYYNGSNYNTSYVTAFFNAANQTTAGPARPLAIGAVIQLGDSATATCVAVNGTVIGHGLVPNSRDDENDRSICLLIKYRRFEYLFTGDLGGGDDDNVCTGRSTSQVNVETPLAQAIMPGGEFPLLTTDGVEVFHVGHHGSESSTNSDYMNLLTPRIACIATGSGQSPDYNFPRHDVVNHVLLDSVYCITAPATTVIQNEEGYPAGNLTSYSGYCVGDIIITTNGITNYVVNGDGHVTEGPDERAALGMPLVLPLEGIPPDSIAPAVHVSAPNGGEQWMAGTNHNITWNATDSFGVAAYSIDYSTNGGGNWLSIIGQTSGNPMSYTWSVPQTPSTNCFVKVTCTDQAGNNGYDISDAAFTIVASPDTGAPFVQLMVPNGGERWFIGHIDTIRWNATDDFGISAYSLAYTTNNGSSWNTIQARTDGNPGVYAWRVPNINTTNCKVRVLVWDSVQRLASDISDAPFMIHFPDISGPVVNVITPNGGEYWTVGSGRYIFWSASDTSGIDSVMIQYSTNSGQSWNIIQPYSHDNPGLYLWAMPETPSRTALVKITAMDILGNVGQDISNASFVIRKTPADKLYYRVIPVAR